MSTYAIGDVQGCFDPLMRLLETIKFDATKDTLWFTGDLINRGPKSLETLRFVKSLGSKAITVLGNHDLAFLAVVHEVVPFNATHYTFVDLLKAEDKLELIEWLVQQPLLHIDHNLGYILVHAGIYPKWDLQSALILAKEVETILQGPERTLFLKAMYGNEPNQWQNTLQGYLRLRFIVNSFTRMRFCSLDGQLELTLKESAEHAPPGYLPWFTIPNPDLNPYKIVFGHWAALHGKTNTANIFALDTGCVWGHALTAMRLEDQQLFSVSNPKL